MSSNVQKKEPQNKLLETILQLDPTLPHIKAFLPIFKKYQYPDILDFIQCCYTEIEVKKKEYDSCYSDIKFLFGTIVMMIKHQEDKEEIERQLLSFYKEMPFHLLKSINLMSHLTWFQILR